MEVGTAEPVNEPRKKKKLKRRPARRDGRGGSGGGGGGDNNNGDGSDRGDDKPKNGPVDYPQTNPTDKSRVLMWFLLLIVLMTFGGLVSAYLVLATNQSLEWRPFALPFQVWVSTAIILASSVCYHVGSKWLYKDSYSKARVWFLTTGILGATFISSQLLVWLELVNRGLYMRGNPYAGFFYILTAVHAVHVIGGIIALGYVLVRIWERPAVRNTHIERKRRVEATAIGWYWHTMDGLWLLLLFLLGFWK